MIVRQCCARRGRASLHAATRHLQSRQYASETSLSDFSKTLTELDRQVSAFEESQEKLQTQFHSQVSESSASEIYQANKPAVTPPPPKAPINALTNKREFDEIQNYLKKQAKLGTSVRVAYDPQMAFKNPPTATELTLPMLMAAQTHLGHATGLWNPRNSSYIFGIRDGIHIISLDATYAHLRRAAKVVQEVARRGGMILFIGTRDRQEEIVVRAAKVAGGYHIFDRWVPGSLTNGQQILGHCKLKVVDVNDEDLPGYSALLGGEAGHPVLKPDLVVCLNPLENEVCLHECGLHTVPTIGIVDTDADSSSVTYPIPANDDSIRSTTLIAGVLGHAGAVGQRQRMEKANVGKATYETSKVNNMLKELEKMANMRIEARGGGSRE